MKSEHEMIEDKLAVIRDNLFDETDFTTDDGYDLESSYMGSPYEVLCGMERKILRQRDQIEHLKVVMRKYHKYAAQDFAKVYGIKL